MTISDLEIVYEWRNSDRVRNAMYTDHLISRPEHEAWFGHALRDRACRHYIAELQSAPVGFISFTAITPPPPDAPANCTWAFYLGVTNVPRGTGSCMEYLALEMAFESLGIHKLSCEVLESNPGVLRLHRKFGFHEEAVFKAHHRRGDEFQDVHRLALFADAWRRARGSIRTKYIEPVTAGHTPIGHEES